QHICRFISIFYFHAIRVFMRSYNVKSTADKTSGQFIKSHLENMLFKIILHLFYTSIQDLFSIIYQNNIVTNFFHLFHAMCTENNGGSFLCKFENFIFNEIAVYRIQAAERFIKNQQLRIMKNSCYKLQFLSHSLAQVIHLFIPPASHFKFHK